MAVFSDPRNSSLPHLRDLSDGKSSTAQPGWKGGGAWPPNARTHPSATCRCYNAHRMSVAGEQTSSETTRPLSGCRVVDLSGPMESTAASCWPTWAPTSSRWSRRAGDPMRDIGPFIDGEPGTGRSLYWSISTPTSAALPSTCAQRREPLRCASWPCVRRAAGDRAARLHGFSGIRARGVGYASLKTDSPGLIYASITPFGQTGPIATSRRPTGGLCHGRLHVRHRLAPYSAHPVVGVAGLPHRVKPRLHRHPAGPVPSHGDRRRAAHRRVHAGGGGRHHRARQHDLQLHRRTGGALAGSGTAASSSPPGVQDGYSQHHHQHPRSVDDLRAWMDRTAWPAT